MKAANTPRPLRGYIKGNTVVLVDPLPNGFKTDDEVEVLIRPKASNSKPFPTFALGVQPAYLDRERIYERDLPPLTPPPLPENP